MSRKSSNKGFWGFLRSQKAPWPESETSEDTGALTGEQEALDLPDDGSFDALFAYLDEEQRDAEAESPTARAESEDRESQFCAGEISEEAEAPEKMKMPEAESPELEFLKEAEIPESKTPELEFLKKEEPEKSEATERKFLKETETPELEAQEAAEPEPLEKPERSDSRKAKFGSGRVLERLRGLEEQISSLESYIIERLNSHR